MKKKYLRILFLILIICICCLIFFFSHQQGYASSHFSNSLTKKLIQIFTKNLTEEKIVQLEEILRPIIRKLAHFTLYFILGLTTISFTNTYNIKMKNKILYTLIFGILYAISDEIHQTFIPERSGNFIDVCIDTSGTLIGIILFIVIIKIFERRKKK